MSILTAVVVFGGLVTAVSVTSRSTIRNRHGYELRCGGLPPKLTVAVGTDKLVSNPLGAHPDCVEQVR